MVTFQQLHLCPGAALDQAGSIPSGFWLLSLSRSAGAGGHSESPTFGSEVCRLSISRGGSSSVICGERPRSLSCLRSFKQNLRGRGKRRSGCEKQNRAKTRYCLVFSTYPHGQDSIQTFRELEGPVGPERPQHRENRRLQDFHQRSKQFDLKMCQLNARNLPRSLKDHFFKCDFSSKIFTSFLSFIFFLSTFNLEFSIVFPSCCCCFF